MKRKGKIKRRIFRAISGFILIIAVLVAIYYFKVKAFAPDLGAERNYVARVEQIRESAFETGNGGWLKKSDEGIWDMYITGKPYALGSNFGALTQKLHKEKEGAFISEIQNRIPSAGYLNILKYFVGWFNRDIDDYIAPEFKTEIYGVSNYMADEFDFIAPKYQRILSYHAAHDIGHALQNMNLVGCTSFAVKDGDSENGKLMLGRNFDFYFGSDFAKDLIVAFYRPDSGYQFMSVTWAGFSGVVSGMNEKGLTITLNSAKSAIPSKGKTPVSIIAREVLQYAENIDEAYAIIEARPSFIAETFLIGSAADGKAALIEKSPDETDIYYEGQKPLIATNHFQSEALVDTPLNLEYMSEGVSTYRQNRVAQLIDSLKPLNEKSIAAILRDQKGLNDAEIGMGNEKAVNQLIAHHSVIFSPEEMMAWVSTPPYMLGAYRAYNLAEIFKARNPVGPPIDTLRSVPRDPFLDTDEYRDYVYFSQTRERIQTFLFSGKGTPLSDSEIRRFKNSNSNSFLTFYYLGEYYLKHKDYAAAKEAFEKGLSLTVARESERKQMRDGIETANSKL